METHVLPRWGDMPLGKVDQIGLQEWVTDLGTRRKPATVGLALRLTSAVLRSAVRNRLIAFNPAEDVRVPRIRRSDTDERIISRADLAPDSCPPCPTATAPSSPPQPVAGCAGVKSSGSAPTRSTSTGHGSR